MTKLNLSIKLTGCSSCLNTECHISFMFVFCSLLFSDRKLNVFRKCHVDDVSVKQCVCLLVKSCSFRIVLVLN